MIDLNRPLRFCFYNCCGLPLNPSAISDLKTYQRFHLLDFIFLAETHPLPTRKHRFSSVIFGLRERARQNQRGVSYSTGGILGLTTPVLRSLCHVIESDQHHRWVIFRFASLYVSIAYFSPSASENHLRHYWNRICDVSGNGSRPFLILGDFNARLGDLTGDHVSNSRASLVSSWLTEDWYLQYSQENTYSTRHVSGGGVPGLCFVSSSLAPFVTFFAIKSDGPLSSDHYPLWLECSLPVQLPKPPFKRWNVRDFEKPLVAQKFQSCLLETVPSLHRGLIIHWRDIDLDSGTPPPFSERLNIVDRVYDRLLQLLDYCLEDSCGVFVYQGSHEDCRSAEIDNLWSLVCNVEEQLHSPLHSDSQRQDLRSALKIARQNHSTTLRKHRHATFRKKADEFTHPSQLNTFLKRLFSSKRADKRSSCLLDPSKVDEYVAFFRTTTFHAMPTGCLPDAVLASLLLSAPECSAYVRDFPLAHPDTISFIIRSLPRGKAPGKDGVYDEILQHGCASLAPALAVFFNICSAYSCMPSFWNVALIHPVYKNKGSASSIENYRPFALTSCIRRVYERHPLPTLHSCDQYLAPTQGGFRQWRSTLDQVYCLEELCRVRPDLYYAFLDIKSAYDCVDRRLLWHRLSVLPNMPSDFIRILRSLFDSTSSVLMVSGSLSAPCLNRRGLLQGSSLSPTLLNHFIDDLLVDLAAAECVHVFGIQTSHLLFADDGALHASSPASLQRLLGLCESWGHRNGLSFNPSKCSVIGPEPSSLSFCNQPLPQIDEQCYLGIQFTVTGINWESTFKKRLASFHASLQWMNSKGFSLGGWRPSTNLLVYTSLSRPLLEYGLPLVPPGHSIVIQLQKAHLTALRKMFTVPFSTSIAGLQIWTGLPTLIFRHHLLSYRFLSRLELHRSILNVHSTSTLLYFNIRNWLLPTSSLLDDLLSNPIWSDFNLLARPTDAADTPAIQCAPLPLHRVSAAFERQVLHWYNQRLIKAEGNVASAIRPSLPTRPDPLLRANFLELHHHKLLLLWRLWRIAWHQPCRSCPPDAIQELSRRHALECSGMLAYLQRHFPSLPSPPHPRMTILDSVLNSLDFVEDELPQIHHAIHAIETILQRCLGYILLEDGRMTRAADEHPVFDNG